MPFARRGRDGAGDGRGCAGGDGAGSGAAVEVVGHRGQGGHLRGRGGRAGALEPAQARGRRAVAADIDAAVEVMAEASARPFVSAVAARTRASAASSALSWASSLASWASARASSAGTRLISRPNSHPTAPNTSDWNALKIVIRFFQIESEVSAVAIMSTPMATNTTSSSAATHQLPLPGHDVRGSDGGTTGTAPAAARSSVPTSVIVRTGRADRTSEAGSMAKAPSTPSRLSPLGRTAQRRLSPGAGSPSWSAARRSP